MKRALLFSFIIFSSLSIFSQNKYTISGYVEDIDSGEKLIGVNVYDSKSKLGTTTNTYGFYSITLPADSVILSYSYVGYATTVRTADLNKDINLNIKLGFSVDLETVEVVAETFEKIEESTQMSTVDVPIEQIRKIPALLGEVDVLKALQLLPGVQSGGEGQNGVYVRGGSPDQNLILLDGVPVYNASHLFGFFSVFNADAIKDVKLMKGGFPARYGGRLSSVIDITMKEGDVNDFHGTGSIGLISSKIMLEGPIKKETTSFAVSARRTYLDIMARPLIKRGFREEGMSGEFALYFYDLNAKINHKFSDKDRVYFSIYNGRDKFGFETTEVDENDLSTIALDLWWGNLTMATRWNHVWTNKLFSNTTLTYSQFKFTTGANNVFEYTDGNDDFNRESFALRYLSGIDDIAAKIDFDYYPNPRHYIRFGASAINHTFAPGEFDIDYEIVDPQSTFSVDTVLGQSEVVAQEFDLYVEDDMIISESFKANVGVHFSGFNVEDKFYTSIQPRLSMRYLLPNGVALKGSFSTMQQYVQLLTNETIGLPTDLWLPTTERVKPQFAWQAALGVAKTFDEQYEVSLEGYYKEMSNLLSFKEGASLFQLNDWQDRVTQGNGESYGLEVFLQKKKGRLSGWIGYTLAWSNRQFDDLNFGKKYPFTYDRRHDFSIVASYDISDRISVAGTWVYGTGNAITLANSVYNGYYPGVESNGQIFDGRYFSQLEYYDNRNNFRMKPYHRFDIGIEFKKQKKHWKRTWTFGAYNAYSRKNPFFVFLDSKREVQPDGTVNFVPTLRQASLIPFLIPSFSYRFEF